MRQHCPDRASTFRLLFVCTGNICRSPFAEILTRHLLLGRLGGHAAQSFHIASAGVQAVVSAPMHHASRSELAPWGLQEEHAGRFAARQLTSALVDDSDLILGASPRHRAAVVVQTPTALGKVFSLREFARLVAAVDRNVLPPHPVERAHDLVDQARRRRGLVPMAADGDGIPDPISGPPAVHHASAVLIGTAVQTIVDAISPPLRPMC